MEENKIDKEISIETKPQFYNRIPPILKNKYVLTTLVFFIWLMFFDRHDIISQVKLRKELKKLEEEKEFYLREIAKDSKNLNELLTNPKTLEKFAREKYLMKKENEDIFVIVKE
jgi:cell division protein FtsB